MHVYTAQGKGGKTPECGLAGSWLRVLNPCQTARLLSTPLLGSSLCLDWPVLTHLVSPTWKQALLHSAHQPGCPCCMLRSLQSLIDVSMRLVCCLKGGRAAKRPSLALIWSIDFQNGEMGAR